jgi:hypothetical protein
MSRPPVGLLDPLADWPRIDPQPDLIRAAIDDLRWRAARWDDADAAVRAAAAQLVRAGDLGRSADAQRDALLLFADACAGSSAALLLVGAALDAYLAAFDAYTARMRHAHDLAQASVAALAAHFGANAGVTSPQVPDTPLRDEAWSVAESALSDFEGAGLVAASAVDGQVSLLSPGWVAGPSQCTWMSTFAKFAGYGHDLKSVPGGVIAMLAGVELVGRAHTSGWSDASLRDLNARAVGAANGLAIKDGRANDASPMARIAVGAAQRAGLSEAALSRVGGYVAVGEVATAEVFDVDTLITAGGEQGLHAAATRTAAGVNGVALAGLGSRLAAGFLADAVTAPLPAVFAVTMAYQLGDLAYDHRKGIVATAEAFGGHRQPTELP